MEVLSDGSVTSARGFMAGVTAAGIKKPGIPDLAIVTSDRPSFAAGAFTTNQVKAAPVYISREHLQDGIARAFVVNSGNANACTHEQGLANAREMAALTAAKLSLGETDVLVASTGVIGVHLPMDRIRAGIAAVQLTDNAGPAAARAIMTTDTRPKTAAVRLTIGGATVTIGGMAKGAGMIHPNMATMLSFVTTDAAVESGAFLKTCLQAAVDDSFNMVTVDGDTSTNDTLILIANGAAGNPVIKAGSPDASMFVEAVKYVCSELAKAVARDGEGATKLIEVTVRGARSREDARKAARTIAVSPLVKTAVYGADPNWGRVLCAAGYSGAEVDQERADIVIGQVWLMRAGDPLPFDKATASEQLKGSEVSILVDLHLGDASAVAWGCDLTESYVDINAKYTT